MNIDKLVRFQNSEQFFRCPICHKQLKIQNNSLVCKKKHCFDISKFGYVNLLLNGKPNENYDKKSFENRKSILENGFYSHVLISIMETLNELQGVKTILDVGCGEGYYSRKLIEALNKNMLAFDISKDAIQIAAKSDTSNQVKWFVSDLENIPLQDKTIDCILDVFSPANYSEFYRILNDDGYIIKIVPTNDHLKEFREKAKEHLYHQTYSNENVVDYFEKHFDLISKKEIKSIYSLSTEERNVFMDMTPLLFHVDKEKVDLNDIKELTIGAVLLVGKKIKKQL